MPDPKNTQQISQVAREALVEMAKDGISPTPANYKKYFERVSGVLEKEPASETLKSLKLRLDKKDNPSLAIWKDAIDVALVKRDWVKIEELMFNVIINNQKHTEDENSQFNNLLYVLESFTNNLDTLFPENSPVRSQVDIIKDLLTEPTRKDKLSSARKALLKIKTPAQLQTQLSDARTFAKKLALEFVKQIESTGDVTDVVLSNFETHQKEIELATTNEELLKISQKLLSSVTHAKENIQEQHETLTKNLHQTKLMTNKIQELETQLQAASEAAKQDYLTGLMNRRGLEEELEHTFNQINGAFSVAILDIDNFKQLNDSMGHAVGDQALKHLANAINTCIGNKGTPARLGGEEFVILFPGLNAENTKLEMEKLQRLLTKDIFMSNDEKRVVTFSAGVAERKGTETPDELLNLADEAMYLAKKTGKNKVIIA